MAQIKVSVPEKIYEMYGEKVVDYKDLIDFVEEYMRHDIQLDPKPRMDEFYDLVKNGTKTTKNSK